MHAAPSSPQTPPTFFNLDLRSLALARVVAGLLILFSIFFEFLRVAPWYYEYSTLQYLWNALLHVPPSQALLGALALLLVFGYQTFAVCLGLWVYFGFFDGFGIHAGLRYFDDVLGYFGGYDLIDDFDHHTLLWAAFLPVGARYAVDCALSLPDRIRTLASDQNTRSVFSAIFYGQFFLIYAREIRFAFAPYPTVTMNYGLHEPLGLFSDIDYFANGLLGVVSLVIITVFPANSGRLKTLFVGFMLGWHIYHVGERPTWNLGYSAAWLAFLPSTFWNDISNRIEERKRPSVLAMFDGECGFCRRTIRILHTFLGIPPELITTVQSDPAAVEIMERRDSWVVRDSRGRYYSEFVALLRFFESSPAAFFIGPMIDWWKKPSRVRWGNKFYRFVADRRGFFGRATSWMTAGIIPRAEMRYLQIVALAAFIFYLYLNYPLFFPSGTAR